METFVETDRIAASVEAVYALTLGLNRGQILTHEDIAGVLNLAPHEGSWDHVVNKVRRRLERERGISTWPDPTVGYKLCTTAEQLLIPVLRARRAIRQVRRGRRSVEALPEKSLTVNQRRARAFLAERSRESEWSLRRDARQLEKQARKLPKPPQSAGKRKPRKRGR
jgi:hypothetical protein